MALLRPNPDPADRFKKLAWPHLRDLLRLALFLTHHQQEAEDLVQDTMVKAFRAIDTFADGTDMRAWLLTILRRTRIDRARAAGRQVETVSIDAGDLPDPPALDEIKTFTESEQSPQEILDQFEDRRIVSALQDLPEEIRWTLLLVDVQQLDHAQTAAILDVPVGTIKSRAHRGRAMLRDKLADFVNRVEPGKAPRSF